VTVDLHNSRGIPQVMKLLRLAVALLQPTGPTIGRQNPAKLSLLWPVPPPAGQRVIMAPV